MSQSKRTYLQVVLSICVVVAWLVIPTTTLIADSGSNLTNAPGNKKTRKAKIFDAFEMASFSRMEEAFDICLQDGSRQILQINSTTGAYKYTNCSLGITIRNVGEVTVRGCTMLVQDTSSIGRLLVNVDTCQHFGTVSIRLFFVTVTFIDRNTADNNCDCTLLPPPPPPPPPPTRNRSAFPDFNGDGFADLAVGIPREDTPITQAGAVEILYGSAAGLVVGGRQFLTSKQAKPQALARYGEALAAGDFDADGFTDLAVGIPGLDIKSQLIAGGVEVWYGGRRGLGDPLSNFPNPELWHQDSIDPLGNSVEDKAESSDNYGAALAAGDFNGDGVSDLAIGVPGESIEVRPPGNGASFVGAVNILYGRAKIGLTAEKNQVWSQASKDIQGNAEGKDFFGSSLAAGDFDGDGVTDLAVGVPGEDIETREPFHVFVVDCGAVNVLYGNRGLGLGGRRSQLWDQVILKGNAEGFDNFGLALAAGDFNGDGVSDLAIGVQNEDEGDLLLNAGAVNVVYGIRGEGLSATNNQIWSQGTEGLKGTAVRQDQFGRALAAADLNGDGISDLAVGVPGEDVGGDIGGDAGAVQIIYGTRDAGLSATDNQVLVQGSDGMVDEANFGDAFGLSVTAADFNGDGRLDLAVGVPLERVGSIPQAGAVHILYGGEEGLGKAKNELWTQDGLNSVDRAEEFDQFGITLSR